MAYFYNDLVLHGLLTPLGQELEYAVYMAFPDRLDPDHDDSSFAEAWGTRLQSPVNTVEIGIS